MQWARFDKAGDFMEAVTTRLFGTQSNSPGKWRIRNALGVSFGVRLR
jgi:hypothetical protein